MTRFEAAVAIVIGAEGTRSNDACDAGGLTVFGHDKASWPDLLVRVPAAVRALLSRSVADLTWDQAILAYRAGYWDFVRANDLPAPLALMLFDAAVNQGLGWAAVLNAADSHWRPAAPAPRHGGESGLPQCRRNGPRQGIRHIETAAEYDPTLFAA